ncbi:branched-chain amino acid ABC transporter permease [Chloroflexota bacterium]
MKTTALKSITQLRQGQLIRLASYAAIIVILILLPPFLPSYVQSLMTKILIFAIFAMSLDLIMGYTGLISLGHAAYFGVGGYTVGILLIHYDISMLWISAPVGILMAVLFAAIFGLIALRVTGFYFIFVTMALGQLLFSIAFKWEWLSTVGVEAIVGIPRPAVGLPWFSWSPTSFYYFVLLAFVLCFFLLNRLVRSPFGYALQGIRDSEPRMRTLGYNTWLYKYIAFIIAGAFAGVGGVLFAYHNSIVVPTHLSITTSALVMFMVILGGTGTLYGPVIGATVLIPVEFYAGLITPERWPLILGGAFVLSIMYVRAGIGVYLFRLWNKVVYRYGNIKG